MIYIGSKHDNMHDNGMFYVLICINNHLIICIDCMLSGTSSYVHSPFICSHLEVKSLAKGLIVM